MAGKYDEYNSIDYDKIEFEKGSTIVYNVGYGDMRKQTTVLGGVVIDPVTGKARACFTPYDEDFNPLLTPGQAFAYRFIAGCERKCVELPDKFKAMKEGIDPKLEEVREDLGDSHFFSAQYESGLQVALANKVFDKYNAAQAAAAGESSSQIPAEPTEG